MGTPQPLIAVIDDFLGSTGMAQVTFGREAMNDPHFVRDLRNGRRVWPETEHKVRGFMAARHCSSCGTQPAGCIAACTRTDCPMRAEELQKVAA